LAITYKQSSDIILTTLKPQLKNVTASDIANSLYYLHLNSDEDAKVYQEEQSQQSDADSTSTTPTQKVVQRKALPDSARSSVEIKRQSTIPLVRLDSSSGIAKRKPVPGSESVPKIAEPYPNNTPLLARRPLGPRPQVSDPNVEKTASSKSDQPVQDSRRTTSDHPASIQHEAFVDKPSLQPATPQSRAVDLLPAFTITVIRRDPSSSSQWNIGTITGTPTTIEETQRGVSPQRNKKPYFALNVHLTNPGYGPFNNSYLSSQLDALKISPISPVKVGGVDNGRSKNARPDYGFTRDIRMEGVEFWKRSMPQHKRSKSDMTVKQGITRGRSFSGSEVVEPTKPQQSGTSNTSKGYAFFSPWNGRCKFMTSSSGRSLRCKHTLPEPVSAVNEDEDDRSSTSSVIVSEIRFNLPSQAIFNSVSESFAKIGDGSNQRFSIPAFDHIRNKFSVHKLPPPYPPRPSRDSYSTYSREDENTPSLPPRPKHMSFNHTESSDDEPLSHPRVVHEITSNDHRHNNEEDEPLDLSLGQEKAGGGNRGKRAKLGKLIIHDEGFKFLDLLVAANMGVWWSVWEPEF